MVYGYGAQKIYEVKSGETVKKTEKVKLGEVGRPSSHDEWSKHIKLHCYQRL